jgi:hypothetical protein
LVYTSKLGAQKEAVGRLDDLGRSLLDTPSPKGDLHFHLSKDGNLAMEGAPFDLKDLTSQAYLRSVLDKAEFKADPGALDDLKSALLTRPWCLHCPMTHRPPRSRFGPRSRRREKKTTGPRFLLRIRR